MAAPLRLDRSLIRVSGPDAASFLNNLVTQDVAQLGEAAMRYAALLSPQGKVVADMLLWAESAERIVLDADPSRGGDLLRRLRLYKLRAQVAIDDISADFSMLWSAQSFEGARADPRLPGAALGWRGLALRTEARDGGEVFDAHRLAAGVPDLARDAAPEEVFALEALLEELHGVDFQKGCFVGQENVSRMKRRGTTRRKFCPVQFDGASLPFGASILDGAGEVGTLRSSAEGRGIALLRLDRALAPEANLTLNGGSIRVAPPSWLLLPAGS
jgi:folate-binding protein YgfZ